MLLLLMRFRTVIPYSAHASIAHIYHTVIVMMLLSRYALFVAKDHAAMSMHAESMK